MNMNYALLLNNMKDTVLDLGDDDPHASVLIARAKNHDKNAMEMCRDLVVKMNSEPWILESTCCKAAPTGKWPKSDLCSFCLDHSTFSPKESIF